MFANAGLEGAAYFLFGVAVVALASVMMLIVSTVILVGRRQDGRRIVLALGLADVVFGCLALVAAMFMVGWLDVVAIPTGVVGLSLIVAGGMLMKRGALAPHLEASNSDTGNEDAFWDQFQR